VEDAITELRSAIDNSERFSEGTPAGRGPRELLEQVYLRYGRKEALRRFYDETLVRLPGDVVWHNRAGAFAVSEADYARAEQLYKRAIELADSRKKAGVPGVDRNQFLLSLDGYMEAMVLGAGSPGAGEGWMPGQLERVFEEGRKYVGGDFASVAYFRMAQAKMKLGDRAAAAQYCRTALQKAFSNGTDEALALTILQRAHSLLGAEEVRKYCEQMLEAEPDSLAANFAMFNVMKTSGEYNKALVHIDKCLSGIGPEDPRRFGYVVNKVGVLDLAYRRTSDNSYLARGISEYESLLAEMPNNTFVLNNLAYLLAENSEKLAEALEYAVRARELAPNNGGVLDTYAYVLYKNGRYSKADEALQTSLQLYVDGDVVVPAEVYEHLGMVKEKLGASAEAVSAYKQALEAGAGELSDSVRARIVSAIERLSGQEKIGN
jgi:tetratricopeptide (TPR) repeat protein